MKNKTKYFLISLIIIVIYGAYTTYLGYFFDDWRYWILLILTVLYGAIRNIEGEQRT